MSIGTIKARNILIGRIKLCELTRIKRKIEDGIGIVVSFANETKIDAETALEANGERGIISTFKVKKKKNTEEIKIKEMLSILCRNEKEELW